MSSIIIKRQSSLTLIVLVLTTLMIAGTIFSASSDDNNLVFAKKHKQSIGQSNKQHQKAVCLSAGANSPISASCNNSALAANANGGGNAAASSGHGSHGGSDQSIGQSNEQHQKAVCLSAGANSPISASCNNSALAANANGGGNAEADD
jgi:ribosomal protein L40E